MRGDYGAIEAIALRAVIADAVYGDCLRAGFFGERD